MGELLASLPAGLDGLGQLARLHADIAIAIEEQQSIIASACCNAAGTATGNEQCQPSHHCERQKISGVVDLPGFDIDAVGEGQIEGGQQQFADTDELASCDIKLSRLDSDLPCVDDQVQLGQLLADLDELEKHNW